MVSPVDQTLQAWGPLAASVLAGALLAFTLDRFLWRPLTRRGLASLRLDVLQALRPGLAVVAFLLVLWVGKRYWTLSKDNADRLGNFVFLVVAVFVAVLVSRSIRALFDYN